MNQKPSLETSSNIKKIDKDRKAEISKMDDDFDYSGLFKQGENIVRIVVYLSLLFMIYLYIPRVSKVGTLNSTNNRGGMFFSIRFQWYYVSNY